MGCGSRSPQPGARHQGRPPSAASHSVSAGEPVVPAPALCPITGAAQPLDACSLLDKTPPQSPTRALPRPLHPQPVVDWDARRCPRLPPTTRSWDEDDFEVCSINNTLVGAGVSAEPSQGGPASPLCLGNEAPPPLEDNLFLPPQGGGDHPTQPKLKITRSSAAGSVAAAAGPGWLSGPLRPSPGVTTSPGAPGCLSPRGPARWRRLSPAPWAEEMGPVAPDLPPLPGCLPGSPLSPQGSRTPSPLVPPGSLPLPPRLSSSWEDHAHHPGFASDPKYATHPR